MSGDAAGGRSDALALALAHEVGNLLTAIRLQAHLVDESAGTRERAAAVVEIEDLADRAGALVALLRLALGRDGPAVRLAPADCIEDVRARIHGWSRGVSLSLECAPGLPDVAVDPDALHHLLVASLAAALEQARPRGRVRLAAFAADDDVIFELEDDGKPREQPARWREAALRGRVLLFALAERLARAAGGAAEAERKEGRTRVRLRLPASR